MAAAAKAKVTKSSPKGKTTAPSGKTSPNKIPLPAHLKVVFRPNDSVEISDSSGDAILVSAAAYPHVAGALSLFAPVPLDPDVLAEAKKKSKIMDGAHARPPASPAPAAKKAPAKKAAAKTAAAKPAKPAASKAKPSGDETAGSDWAAGLPSTVKAGPNVSLKKVSLLVDLRRSSVEEAKPGDKDSVAGYAIIHKGEKAGYVIAQSEDKFVIVAPTLNAPRSQHRGLGPTTHRLEMLTS